MQQNKSLRMLTVIASLVTLMPSLVLAAPCHKTMPVTMGSTATCDGLLVPEATVREAVRCGAATLPKCRADLRLCEASSVNLLTPPLEESSVNAQSWVVAVSFLTVGVIVGLSLIHI